MCALRRSLMSTAFARPLITPDYMTRGSPLSVPRAVSAATSNEVIIALPQRDTKEISLDAGRAEIVQALSTNYPGNPAEVRSVEIVGPQVGSALRNQAILAAAYSLAGMLVYLWFRFELIYGVAAVVAVFHDTLITIGFFSLFNYEISLTVIAAILTLIGYSMNDTIVVFDRIRENLGHFAP